MAANLRYQFAYRQAQKEQFVRKAAGLSDDTQIKLKKGTYEPLMYSLGTTEGPLLLSWIESDKKSIVSQIAVKLTKDAIQSAASDCLATYPVNREGISLSSAIARECFREANQQVYNYAHRMAVGGKVGARGFISVFDGERFSVAKVGSYASYLLRNGELARLHEQDEADQPGTLQRFIGANVQILVDLASTTVAEGDLVILTTIPHREELADAVGNAFKSYAPLDKATENLLSAIVPFALVQGDQSKYVLEHPVAVMVLEIGRPVIKLTQVVRYQ